MYLSNFITNVRGKYKFKITFKYLFYNALSLISKNFFQDPIDTFSANLSNFINF